MQYHDLHEMLHHTIWWRIILYHGISCHTYRDIPYHYTVKPYRIIPCHALPWCILHDAMSTMTWKSRKCHDIPYQPFPWHHMLCIMSRLTMQYLTTAYHTSSYAMPFHTLTYQASPWHTLSCYAIPWSQTSYTYINRGSHNQRCHQRMNKMRLTKMASTKTVVCIIWWWIFNISIKYKHEWLENISPSFCLLVLTKTCIFFRNFQVFRIICPYWTT